MVTKAVRLCLIVMPILRNIYHIELNIREFVCSFKAQPHWSPNLREVHNCRAYLVYVGVNLESVSGVKLNRIVP